jgi:hypothetical protein
VPSAKLGIIDQDLVRNGKDPLDKQKYYQYTKDEFMIDSDVEFLKIRKYLHMTKEQLKDPKVQEAYNIMLDFILRKKKLEITANMYKDGALVYKNAYANILNKGLASKFNNDMDTLSIILNPSLIKEQNIKEKLEATNLEEAYKDIMEKTQIKDTKKADNISQAKEIKKDIHHKDAKASKSPKKEKSISKDSQEDELDEEVDSLQNRNKLLAKEKKKIASLTSAMHRKQAKEKRNNLKKKFFKNKLEKSQPTIIEAE